ncbi:hypothetical protein [Paraburkholderia sp. GAS82]|uniref:hypothetical protein n=1 Tax=Paraburkholderia sp. GAS82 TaxID=3035137 RepID=UPI003D2178AE
MSDLIEDFRQSIRQLKPDGDDGFEGLMAAVLSDLTKRSFALASAGSQHGKDGQSALDGGVIVFEAKRYDDAVPKDKIYTKILEIAADKSSTTELYILAATGPISAQHITTLKDGGQRLSMALMVLAWPETGLSELAALIAMTPEVSTKFIGKHTSINEAQLDNQLSAVRAHPQFQARSDELLVILRQPSIAPAFALKENVTWLSEAFSDKRRARSVFGQALSPEDPTISGTIDRTNLRTKVANKVFAKPDGVVTAILGADGNGKSWIFAQAWSHQSNPPLTIIIVPDDIDAAPSLEYCQDLLISKLLTQTGETRRSDARERWLSHFERWQRNPDCAAPRLVVFMDGINQRDSVKWLRFMDSMSAVVAQLGGTLVFSCRQLFYRDNLENKLVSRVVVIDVPEWTDAELEELLKERGTSIAALDAAIVRSLRNPRIFGVAAALFKAEEITGFGELSVSRLLFEHIRSGTAAEGTAVSSKQFAADICTHAENIVQRLKQRQIDGLNEFDMPALVTAGRPNQTISEQFVITSAGRFFEVLDENPNKYVLKDEGLPLALGLALVRTAREALRKQKSIDEALANILDPIAALDRTSDILLGAILSAVLEAAPQEVVASLVRSFVMLQNLDSKRYPEFRNLFGRNPQAFLAALEYSALTGGIASNLSWLTDAADDLSGNKDFETELEAAIHRWLNMYSLAPERMVPIPRNSEHAAEYERKRAEREGQLSATIASLSPTEYDLLAGMTQESRGDYSQLSLIAFQALAGRPLAPFAESLRNWCFAASLNGGYRDHHDDFDNLLHFNLVDWAATKDALRHVAKPLRRTGMSQVGQWALVYVLRATGDSGDAEEAGRIAEELTKDREPIRGWRAIEDYCATDPCDPASEEPDNIVETASAYGAINPAELCRLMGNRQGDYFFRTAQPGLARFRPEVAVEVLRALADQAVTRAQPEFRQAIFLLESHTVGLEDRVAMPYVEKAREIAQAVLDANEDRNDEGWVAAQYALSVAFPHMTGDEQFDALINHPKDRTILIELGYSFQPIDETKLESALDQATTENNFVAQFRILCFAEYSRTSLTARTKDMVLGLLASTNSHVRLSALALIQATADPFLLAGLVLCGWSAATLDAVSDKVEILHGSQALVLAAEQGSITLEACLDRIAPSAYESLAERLGPEAVIAIADRLNTGIHRAAEFQVTGNLPDIEQSFEGRHWSVIFEVSEKPPQVDIPHERIQRLAETGDAWYERRKQSQEAADRFERDLTEAGALLIIQSVTVALIAAIDKVTPALVDTWQTLILRLDSKSLSNLHNIALVVAEVISKRNVGASLKLFERLRMSSAHVRVTFGRDKVDLEAVTAWGAADSAEMKDLCFARLDRIGNDHDLAMEVLAAIRSERLNVLRDYVVDRRHRPEPAHRARAVMVAGLSPDEPWAIETVQMLKDEHGFLRRAYEGATYAMERHQWSRHWAAQMCTASDPVDLWRATVLLAKIVDGRFKWSDVEGDAPSPLIKRFGTTLNSPIRDRIRKWKNRRNSKLFGMNVPNKTFLPGD